MKEKVIQKKESYKRSKGTIEGFVISGNAHAAAFKVRWQKQGNPDWITEESHSAPREWDIETDLQSGDNILITVRVVKNSASPLTSTSLHLTIKDKNNDDSYTYTDAFGTNDVLRYVILIKLI